MKWLGMFVASILLLSGAAAAQGIVGDVFSGKLIKPEVGVYAWYDLKDNATNQKFLLRQAVVGEEKVGLKKGYWVETQVIPEIGFPSIYKMLLTGPANDTKNVHKIIVKEGQKTPVEIPLDSSQKESEDSSKKETRESVGKEKITTGQGEIEAEHILISKSMENNAAGQQKVEVWLNDEVRPMGIVKMTSPSGDLVLQRYGKGGPDGTSAIDALKQSEDPTAPTTNVKVNVEGGKPLPAEDKSVPLPNEGEKSDETQ
ncbi:MAG TPA: hypothetical protein PLI09_16075 [Candidatus Hydrogenedentes bacterium]|nr:hypothetical protein [Candidatus Hydrogenedentota bacterium]